MNENVKAGSLKFWNKAARKYSNQPVKDRAGYEKTLEDACRYSGEDKAVPELGCGTGSAALKPADACGDFIVTDSSTVMIAIAIERKSAAEKT